MSQRFVLLVVSHPVWRRGLLQRETERSHYLPKGDNDTTVLLVDEFATTAASGLKVCDGSH